MTTVSPEWQRWVEAAKVLAADPRAQVLCPRNADAYLQVSDVALPDGSGHVDRYLRCPVCDAHNVIHNPTGR